MKLENAVRLMKYPINEFFTSIQTEAIFSGTPAFFIRMQGCEVGCGWCDTKHTWSILPQHIISIAELSAKSVDSETYTYLDEQALLALAEQSNVKHVVITGGEPCQYDLRPLSNLLIEKGFSVQIETSGTADILAHPHTWVTVSPKINMSGNKALLLDTLKKANEIKMPVGKEDDIYQLKQLPIQGKLVYLQPLSLSPKATDLCITTAIKEGWQVSIQWHKMVDIR
ncbi:7-carboxy-7-deazaguanine synthase QueE [Thiofilum flexile]|uniref:7-carboxy-7-deazaguanine synthase QueE n=1 Tax=Thiofilum flexile TaxID=125627 RepID=UPI0003761C70|nr:7-carboxy-7-deazaguanine synthase QueE [Thiofilum flexile]